MKTNIAAALLMAYSSVMTFSSLHAADPLPAGNVLANHAGDWEYAVEFSDEFDGSQIDTTKWDIDVEDFGTWSWEPENAFQKGGSFNLQMVQESHERGGKKFAYKSGMSRQYKTITYGYFEARVKGCERFPGASPAFWLHSRGPENRYTARDGETVAYSEIDVIELQQSEFNPKTKQNNGPEIIDCNLHNVLIKNGVRTWQRPGTHPETNKNEYHASFDPRADYHVYAVENNEDFVIWYIDGKEVARKPNLYWHLPMHLTLSLGLRTPFEAYRNGERVAVLDKTTSEGFPTTMSVDYVRVWRDKNVAQPTAQAGNQNAKPKPNSMKKPVAGAKTGGAMKPKQGIPASNGMNKEQFIAMEKAKWEQNGWPWNQEQVEANFAEMDANQDGAASGQERQDWFAKKKASLK